MEDRSGEVYPPRDPRYRVRSVKLCATEVIVFGDGGVELGDAGKGVTSANRARPGVKIASRNWALPAKVALLNQAWPLNVGSVCLG